ncbi:hypothetical protein EVAR_5846_1 [Eumeta japonica]|uniref:Uncharacterized protein n=1 Tax=Eumeta variegata TaxID=151549 RepID=A0A4C1TEK0_EUMVA|nr:hypothetical protein EVAR_5846_1 [Eumeta japonica]
MRPLRQAVHLDTSAPRTLAPVPTKAAPAIVAVPARTIVAYPPYVTRSIKLISHLAITSRDNVPEYSLQCCGCMQQLLRQGFLKPKCRPKHVLSDPDDSITFAIAKSSFSPQKNTPGHYHKLCDPVIPDRAYSVIRNFCQVQRSSTSDLHFQTPNTEVTRAA